MSTIRRALNASVLPNLFGSSVLPITMTSVGVFTFVAGVLYLPSLAPSRIEMFILLLLLATVAMLCHVVGQLSVIVERLSTSRKNS